jgi:PKD repeat protein
VAAQVTADFTADVTSGCGPLVVNFQNLSTNATTYQWNFGNGNGSTQQNPSAVYTTPGTYAVTLTANGPGGPDVEVKTAFINVFTPANADFTPSQTIGCFPFTVTFNDQSAGGSSPIVSYSWDFGDGGTSSTINPTHTYGSVGVFDITVILTDANGCVSTEVFNNIITSTNNRPTAVFAPNTMASCLPPVTVQFSNTSNGGTAPLTYAWTFGDGGTSTQTSPSHDYLSAGNYDASLIVTDQFGCTDTLALDEPIVIANTANVNFDAVDNTVCIGDTVQFNDLSNPVPTSWSWDFGDGTTSTLQNPTHIYTTPGSYTVVMNAVYDATCNGQRTRVSYIGVSPAPSPAFTANQVTSCNPPLTVNFTNQSSGSGPLTYAWTFGTGGQSSAVNPTRNFNNPGSFDVSLTATNSFGCSATLLQPGYINVGETQAAFTSDVVGFCLPVSVNFSNASITGSAITGYLWDFGDGTTSTSANPNHVYNTSGFYDVTLTIQTAQGCNSTVTVPSYIIAATLPTADFTVDAITGCAGEAFQFTDQSSGANGWLWEFGDGQTSNEQNPLVNLSDGQPIDVTLTVSNFGCTATITENDLISVSPPFATIESVQSCQNPQSVQFSFIGTGVDSFLWDFGDGTTSTQASPDHTYPTSGQYIVSLTLINNQNGCVNEVPDTVNTSGSSAIFSMNGNTGCAPLNVGFIDASVDAVSWQWDFGDGSTSLLQNPIHVYDTVGNFNVSLTVTDINGCASTLTVPNAVQLSNSQIDFTIAAQSGCDELSVTFQRQITPSGSATSALWDFGDGTTSTQSNPTHIYTVQGEYDVTLTIVNVAGCETSFTQQDFVQFNSYPESFFNSSVQSGCVGQEFQFNNNSQGSISTYLWDFGDGSTSSEEEPVHAYTGEGVFTVTLTVTSALGCSDTRIRDSYITVSAPDAQFNAFPTFGFCPPLLVNFVNSSTGATSYLWDFGDGATSTLATPSHIYTSSGSFTVSLIAYNADGCPDTIIQADLISILGPSGNFSFSPLTQGCAPHVVDFVSNASGAASYTWDFGDGFLSPDPNVTHQYDNVGTYVPLLILQDNNGCSFTYQSPDTIVVFPLTVDAGADVVICQGETITLGASGAGSYSWFPPTDLDDATSATPVGTPSQTTTFILTGFNGQCVATDTVEVTVNPTPQVSFTVAPVCDGKPSVFANLTFIDAPGVIVSYDWDMAGIAVTDQNPTFVFIQSGQYDVTLTATSDAGCSDSFSAQASVNANPVADFSFNDACHLQPTNFADESTVASGSIQSWQWALGNGSTSIDQNPSLTYIDPGFYDVTLIVTAVGGCSDTLTQQATVNPLPVASFSVNEVCFGDTTFFTEASTVPIGNITGWDWILGDGTTSTAQQPDHVYSIPGTYVAALTAISDQGCEDEFSAVVEVRPLPSPEFTLSAPSSCDVPATVSFTNISVGATDFEWDFGDGQGATSFNATSTYVTTDTFNVVLTATNHYGCVDSVIHPFIVYLSPIAKFSQDPAAGCEPLEVTFINGSENYNDQRWVYGDGDFSNLQDPVHTYQQSGSYSVTLVVTGAGGCTDSLTVADAVNVFPSPVAGFDHALVGQVNTGVVQFSNTSSPHVATFWEFGDGTSSITENPSHAYSNYGSKLITLAVTDANGCVDTLEHYIAVEFFGDLHVPTALVSGMTTEAGLFLPKGTGMVSYRMQIFDEWGSKLFESTKLENGQPADGWDGTYNGEKVPQGAYVWKIDAVFGTGELWPGSKDAEGDFSRTGTVTVLY